MSYQHITYETAGRIVYITLNRPESLNAMDEITTRELRTALGEFDSDPEAWVAILAGNGRAVHGPCYGYGLSLAAECDAIIATQDAAFCLIETRLGMLPVTVFAHLSAWMGSKRLTEMIMTADPLMGAEAYRLGLVNQLVESRTDLIPAADDLARRILQNPPLSVRPCSSPGRRHSTRSAPRGSGVVSEHTMA